MLMIAAGLIGLATLAPDLDKRLEPAQNISPASGGFAVNRAPDGQFYADAKVGAEPIRFLIDAGADQVLIAGPDAARLGLPVAQGFAPVTLAELALGPHRAKNVTAIVAPDLPVSLLGRSFLSRLQAVEVEGARMVLR